MSDIFPRGGKPTKPSSENEVQTTKGLKRHAQQNSGGKKKKQKIRHDFKVSQTSSDKSASDAAKQILREGLLVLGRVKEVQDFRVMVSLPHGLLGTLPITSVSTVYTQRLQSVAEAEETEEDEDLPTLKDMVTVGEGVLCRVMSVRTENKKRFVELSSDPRVINKDLPRTALKAGCLLYGAIQSVEEHGYMLDIGIPGIQAFLAKDQSSDQGVGLSVGKCVWCAVSSHSSLEVLTGEARVVTVTLRNLLQEEISPTGVTSLECLHPGMKVSTKIEKVTKDRLFVKCIKYKGCIHKNHAPQSLSSYAVGQEVDARILYTHPSSKVLTLSLLPGVLGCVQPQGPPFNGLTMGDTTEGEVLYVDKGNAVFFKLQAGMALAPLQHLSDEKVKDLHQAFPPGSKHRCRVISFQPADDVVVVSLKESVMKQKILSIHDIQPGVILKCEVEATHPSGVIVSLTKRLTGLIPKIHASDVPVKDFAKKFPKGKKLKCLVLKVDVGAKKVTLSHKKSLLKSDKRVASTYQDLRHGDQLEGYVIAVKNSGVAVGFCSDVKGWVPRSELSTADIADPETAFHKGQVVQCRVLSCQSQHKKLLLSFIISGKAGIGSKRESMEDFVAGKLMQAKVIEKLERNFRVELLPSGKKALLPREHLADSPDNQLLLWRSLKAGDVLDSVMLLKQTNVVIVTLKESFLSAAREGLIPQSIEDLYSGQLLPAVIKNHQSYGVFVELPGGLGGLAPNKLTMNRPVLDLTKVFAYGQSVVVKVIEVKEDKGRFLCSLRMSDCFHDNPKIGLEMLETYLNERDVYLDSVLDEKAAGVKVGSVVRVEVISSTPEGYVCRTDSGMPAIVSSFHADADVTVGSWVEGVVLHVSVDQTCLELSLDRSLVRSVSKRREKPRMDRARVGQVIKGRVEMIHADFVLLSLKQHAAGTLAYLPSRQHPNDVLADTVNSLSLGEEIKVSVQKCEDSRVLAILASLVKEEEEHARHTLKLGEVVSAHVQTVLPCQVNIKIGKVKGRVHVTEALDEDKIENGMFPFSGFCRGQKISVKIIGFRHFKSFKYLPISHPRIHKALPECSLKTRKIQAEGCPLNDQASAVHSFKAGDKAPVFAVKFENNKLWVSVTPTQNGVISIFDLSRDLGVLKHAEKHFTPGHAYMATVLGVEEEGLIHFTLTGKREQVKKNEVVTAQVTSNSQSGLFLRLPGDFRGAVPSWDVGEEGEGGEAWNHAPVGSFLRCRVLCCKDRENCVLSLSLLRRSEDDLKKAQRLSSQARRPKRKDSTSETESTRAPSPSKKQTSVKASAPLIKEEKEEAGAECMEEEEKTGPECMADAALCLSVDEGFLWDRAPQVPETSAGANDSSEEEEEEEEADTKKSKKKKKKKTNSSASLESEMKMTAFQQQTEAVKKGLLCSPNDSRLWIQLMSLQLSENRVQEARGVARQALNTISRLEEQEKLNVWISLINLENMHGSPEELASTVKEALKLNDPLKLHRHLANMYCRSDKMEEAEQTHRTLTRKFSQERQVWRDYALFLYRQGQLDAARKLLNRALAALHKTQHVSTIAQFAVLEGKHGDLDRAQTMFEKILREFPKRNDVRSMYTDLMKQREVPEKQD